MTATVNVLELTIEHGGLTYTREFRKSDAKGNSIILGRLSSSAPDEGKILNNDQMTGIGGFITSRGRAAFLSPVMSRKHAELTFTDEGIFISDQDGFSHHGTWIRRNLISFRVTNPVQLRNEDVITFGKAVHRGGQSYEPLKAAVKLSSDEPSLFNMPSFTGHGYALPGRIDDEYGDDFEEDNDVYKDDAEDYEHPSTHKHYAEQEVPDSEPEHSPVNLGPIPSYMTPMQFIPGQYNPPPPVAMPSPSPWRLLYNYPEQPVKSYPEHSYAPQQSLLPSFVPMSIFPPPSPPPILPPIIRQEHEVIDVDAASDRVIIDVDALESDVEGSDPEDIMSESESDSGSGSDMPVSPKLASRSPSPEFPRDRQNDNGSLKAIQDLSKKIDEYIDDGRDIRNTCALNKQQMDAKLASFQVALDEVKAHKVDAANTENDERKRLVAELEKRKAEALEDIESRKRSFLGDLDIFEDDVTYEVDRVMETVDEVGKEVGKGKERLEELVEKIQELGQTTEGKIRDSMASVEKVSAAAVEMINETITTLKRKRAELEEAEAEAAAPPPRPATPSPVEAPAVDSVDGEPIQDTEVIQVTPAPSPTKRRRLGLYTAAITAGMTYYALGRF